MPDMRLTTAVNVAPADAKARPAVDQVPDMSNSQFLDMMMSRLSELGSSDNELKTLLTKVSEKNGTNKADNEALLNHLKKMHEQTSAAVTKTDAVAKKTDAKEKIKARVKEIAAQDTTPVKDTKAMKALQKVAKFLIKANEDGDIQLPPAMVQKLQDFLAKGDDLKAFDMASFMSEFTDVFKSMTVVLPAAGSAATGDLQWPDDIKDALSELGMKSLAGDDSKPLDIMSVLRTVKSLVNQSEKAAMQSLDDKANAAVAAQDNTDLLAVPVKTEAQVKAPVTAPKDVKADVKTTIADKAVETAQNLQMTAMGLPQTPVMKKDSLSLTQTATVKSFDDKKDKSDLKPSDMPSRHLSAEAVKAAAASQNTGAAAADVKAAFNVAAPVLRNDIDANANSTSPTSNVNGIAAPGSLAAKTATANAEILRDAAATKPGAATQQVMAQIQSRGNKSTQISVQLTPAELGRVEVRLNIGKNGQANAIIVADTPETLALLQKDAAHLERSLQQAGINTNAGNMSFNLRDQNQAQQFGQGRKRFSRDAIADVKTQDIAVNVMADMSVISDTRINYHA